MFKRGTCLSLRKSRSVSQLFATGDKGASGDDFTSPFPVFVVGGDEEIDEHDDGVFVTPPFPIREASK